MWGDSERAITLDSSDPLAGVLFQVTGPAHIPWQDPRWQELLHGYNVWVHLDVLSPPPPPVEEDDNNNGDNMQGDCLNQACRSLLQHAPRTSNLAALCLHVTRMLREVLPPTTTTTQQQQSNQQHHRDHDDDNTASNNNNNSSVDMGAVELFSNRIALVGKARAVAGALNLLRILCHAVMVHAASLQTQQDGDDSATPSSVSSSPQYAYLQEVFLYSSRDSNRQVDTASDLLSAICQYLHQSFVSSEQQSVQQPGQPHQQNQSETIPELYDTTVLCLQLLLVLFSSQLYQPMISSFQQQQQQQAQQQATRTQQRQARRRRDKKNDDGASSLVIINSHGYFWDLFWRKAHEKANDNGNTNTSSTTTTTTNAYRNSWTPQSLVLACLSWHMERPKAPPKSIAHYWFQLAQSVVEHKGERKGPDGMYDNYQIVLAAAAEPGTNRHAHQQHDNKQDGKNPTTATTSATSPTISMQQQRRTSSSSKLILDATKGVLVLSSTIILLPFRLVSLALGLWGHHAEKGFDKAVKGQLASHLQSPQGGHNNNNMLTKDALWLSDSTVADLATCLLLLWVNNQRVGEDNDEGVDDNNNDNRDRRNQPPPPLPNPFRTALKSLSDNRWETNGSALPDLPDFLDSSSSNQQTTSTDHHHDNNEDEERTALVGGGGAGGGRFATTMTAAPTSSCSLNFESLFESFHLVTHTELGALLLYTILQASHSFAEAVAVRSDLDTLIVPMLRTLYFASSSRHFIGPDRHMAAAAANANNANNSDHNKWSIRNCPFRSLSQLYVIIILLLLFSQDSSFGADAFRRIKIPVVPFYKERNLKEISLGSLLVLSLLRSLTFNLNRLGDPFLLSNCCAILMNLSNSVTDLHDYAAMRLVSVTISTCKKYSNLYKEQKEAAAKTAAAGANNNNNDPTSMYREVSKTLLRVLRRCLDAKSIDGNLHLVYALVYHQTDLQRVFASTITTTTTTTTPSPFRLGEVRLVERVAKMGATLTENHGARVAAKALKVLADNMDAIKQVSLDESSHHHHHGKKGSSSGGGGSSDAAAATSSSVDDFTFTYEEEADPEVFFVPYLWEVIVCAVTAGSIGWRKRSIQVFPLLDDDDDNDDEGFGDEHHQEQHAGTAAHDDLPHVVAQGFAKDVSDIV